MTPMKDETPKTLPFSLYFDEDAHRYLVDTEKSIEYWQPLPSVTQFVGHYIPPFDAQKAAAKKARFSNPPKTAEQILAEWDAKRIHACELGTRVHANQESMMNGSADFQQPADDRERSIMSSGWEARNAVPPPREYPLVSSASLFISAIMIHQILSVWGIKLSIFINTI